MFPSYRNQICPANQLTRFYVMKTLVVKGLTSQVGKPVELQFCEYANIAISDAQITCIVAHCHCVKSVQILSYFWSVFSYIRTECGEIRYLSVFSPNTGKYGPEITPYLDTFHAVCNIIRFSSDTVERK